MSESPDQRSTSGRAVTFEAYGGGGPENYEKYFVPVIGGPLAADLIARAALRPGERVLDVACGTGVIARLAAERIGPGGKVAGLDLNAGMLATARSVAPPAARIEWHEATAEAMPLPDEAFDVVICQLGLMFVPDKPAALREMRRVLVGGGRLLVSVPGPTPPIFAIMDEALARHVGVELAGFVRIVFSMHDPDALRGLLTGAGLRDVHVEREMRTLPLAPPKEFLWQYIHSTPLAGAVSAAGPERRAAFEREVLPRWQEFVRDGKLQFDVGITVGTARK